MQLLVQAAAAMPDESERYKLIPARLEGRLMAFQREGVKFALRHGGRALIGDEMGLGKTVQVLQSSLAHWAAFHGSRNSNSRAVALCSLCSRRLQLIVRGTACL